ncbi:allophanate hydrolase, partial [Aeromonas cavernicola]
LRHWHPQIRILPGPELAQCDEASQTAFWQQPWRVSPQSDRMGYRLQGPTLQLRHPLSLLSHGVLPGLIQLPPSGAPIILLADAQTTGGYPRIGCVIDADLWLLAQARPGSVLQCVPCTVAQAHAARRLRQAQAYRFAYALAMADRA